MSNENIPTSPLPTEFAFGPRMRLQDMPGLRAERWNLLPGDSMGADQLESSLAWQEGIYPEWFGSPCLEIRWSPNLTNPARAAKVLGSIAAQSVTRFQLQVLIADDEASQKYSEFGRFVEKNEALSLSELVEAMNLSSRTQVVVGSLPEESAAEWIFVLSPEDCLHPMALFCLLKSARADSPDVVCFFETLTDEATGGPHAVHMIRGVSLYSILGDAGVSRSLLFSAEAARMLGLNQGGEVRSAGEDDFPEWRWMLVAGRIGMRVHRLSLALTAIEATRGHPVSHGRGAKGVTSTIKQFAKVKEIDLRNWRFDEVRGSGAPVPVPSSLAIAAIIPFRDQEELTAATFRSLANQSVAKRVRLVAVDNGSAPEVAGRLRKLAADLFGEDRLTWLSVDAPFNFATLNNRGVAACDEPHVLFLNNDVEFLSREDLAHLQGFLEWPEVGMVGGALYYPDGQLQASGIRFGPAGPEVVRDPEGGALIFREVEALTFACALARREAFVAAGMLDEVICPNGFGDALLGYRMNEAGWRILCDPAVSIRHHESKSRGSRPEELERMELDREGLPIYLYGTEFARPGQESVHRFGRSRPTWGKRIYRAVKAFRRELCG